MAGVSAVKADKAISFARSQIGKSYAWIKVMKKGTQLLLHLNPRPERFLPSPNDIIVRTEGIELVVLV
jgi:hypothetical protein